MAAGDAGPQLAHNHHHSAGLVALDPSQRHVALGLGRSPDTPDIEPLEVKVNGIQYAWVFTYPDSGVISGEIHVPVDRPVSLTMTGGDVIHAFWLPEFRIKQDVIPGRETTLVFTPNKIGQYPVICAELCGAYHGGMKTQLYVQSQEEYEQWIQDNTFAANPEAAQSPVAVNSQPDSDQNYLAPYAEDLGVDQKTLAQLQP